MAGAALGAAEYAGGASAMLLNGLLLGRAVILLVLQSLKDNQQTHSVAWLMVCFSFVGVNCHPA